MKKTTFLSLALALLVCAGWFIAPARAATFTVQVPSTTTGTNGMLAQFTAGRMLQSTAVQVTGLTNLTGIGSISVYNLNATNTITLGGTNILTLISSVIQVFSGTYGGGLPTDTPTTSAALAFDLDTPGTLYFWDGALWY